MLSNWQQWCRLCARVNSIESTIGLEFLGDLNFTIQKYFLINRAIKDIRICAECHEFVVKLQYFTEKCDKANALFNKILHANSNQQNDVDYLQSLRYDAGMDEEQKFMMMETDHDQQGVDNFLFTDDTLSQEKIKNNRTVGKRRSTRFKPKEEAQAQIEECDVIDPIVDVKDNDPAFDMEATDEQNSDDDASSSTGELGVSQLKTAGKKTKKKQSKSTQPLQRQLKCLLCRIDFDEKRVFDNHMREEHTKDEKPFLCEQCPKRFKSLRCLIAHENIHMPEENREAYPCQFCDKRFKHLEYVQTHIKIVHTGECSFICEECGKGFVLKSGLKEHLLTHNNDTIVQCSYCPKAFKNVAQLRTHEDIHKHTTYICPQCGLQLNTKRTLRMHMVVHSDQKKFKCQYCGNEYKRAKTLKTHLILHSGLRPYTCQWCDKTFTHGANFRSHKKKAHPVELAELEASGQSLPAVNIPKLNQLQPK